MRVEIWQTRRLESLANNFADRRRIGPTFAIEASDFEMATGSNGHPSRRKKGILLSPKGVLFSKRHPFREYGVNIRSNRIKVGHEGFRKFRPDFGRIFENLSLFNIDMLQPR